MELEWYVNTLSENVSLRVEMGKNAEKYALKNFNADINAAKTFSHYE